MKKRILVDVRLLGTYMEYVAKGDVTPDVESFLAYQRAVLRTIQAKKISEIKPAQGKIAYRINVNERLDFNHTYTVELPKEIDDEEVWNKIDNCTGTGKTTDINDVVAQYGGKILDIEVDITPAVDIEVDEVEVISSEK